jgi:hypothetical protein
VSVADATTTRAGAPVGAPGRAAPGEACPLCGAALHPQQEWCLSCGAAARTRLAAAPNWKGPVATLAVVSALSLGVLAAALVKLASGSPATASTTVTRTVTSSPAALTPTRSGTAPGASGSTTGAPGTTVTGSTARSPTPGIRSTPTTGTRPGRFGLGKRLEERLRRRGLVPGAPIG